MTVAKIEIMRLAGEILESADHLKKRTGRGETALNQYVKQGMPKPVKIGNRRYYDPSEVDLWLLRHE